MKTQELIDKFRHCGWNMTDEMSKNAAKIHVDLVLAELFKLANNHIDFFDLLDDYKKIKEELEQL